MARQGMLKTSACVAALTLASTLATGPAAGQTDEPEGILKLPERLTVDVADELVGQISPDHRTLYFVSNRRTMSQVFAQSIADGRARPLFDDDADVTWPRVSPDGRHLLYISFAQSALGQLCVRDLPGGTDGRCLTGPVAALQAEWIDAARIVLVSRESVEGDLRVLEVGVASTLSARPMFVRNLSGPAVSPDGQWLLYVPIERAVSAVGPAFAAHAARRLEAARLGSGGAAPLAIDLPGLTSQPVFARDGRSIYFVQFLDDSNQDGVVDAADDGVLFRAPFSVEGGLPTVGPPRQLTDVSYNCQYPTPAADLLVATCAQGRALSIYSLPLEGEVPATWGKDRLAAETEAADTKAEQQLLASVSLSLETSSTRAHRLALLRLVTRYLDLGYYEAAGFFAQHVSLARDRETAGLSSAVSALVDQRRAEAQRERGVMIHELRQQARQRLDDLRLPTEASSVATALAHVVRSEIADFLGDKTLARFELESASVDANAGGASVAEVYYDQADRLYRELDDREALVEACRRLSENPALGPDERLRYGRAAVQTMTRGLPRDQAGVRLERERAGAPADSDVAFAIDLARTVLALEDADPPPTAGEELLSLYARQVRPERRGAIAEEAARRVRGMRGAGARRLVEPLVQRYLRDSSPGTQGRRRAERLFRRVMVEAARQLAAGGQTDEARAAFDAVAEQTGSYESVVASIDLRLMAGESPALIGASYEKPRTAAGLSDFARAYVFARELPDLAGDDEAKTTAGALGLVRASWAELRSQRMGQALDGALLHARYLQTHDAAFAERANVHYVIALEGMRRGAPLRAMVLGFLGILHTQVGNYRIALDYLQERDQLPHADDPASLCLQLALARSLLHVGREAEAAAAADAALAMVERTTALAPYGTLVRDRDALYNFAAGRTERALVLYDGLVSSLDSAAAASEDRNRFVAHLGRAAAAVGAGRPSLALSDLDVVEGTLDDPARAAALKWSRGTSTMVVRSYRLLAAGLRARAYEELGRPVEEARAIETRRAILAERFAATKRIENELDLMLAETQLALNAAERRDAAGVASALRRALQHSDDLRARSHGQVDKAQLGVLWAAAYLSVSLRASPVPDLAPRLKATLSALATQRDPSLQTYSRRFEVYLPLVHPP